MTSPTSEFRSSRSARTRYSRSARCYPAARPHLASLPSQLPETDRYNPSAILDSGGPRGRLFDHAYLTALADHNQEVEAHLVNFFARPVWLKLRTRLRSPQLVEDARQETFLRVFTYFRAGKTLENPASLPGFVLSVCSNVSYEVLRAETRHPQIPEDQPDMPDLGMNPEQTLVTEERKQLVKRILLDLSEKDRALLRRVFLDEADKDDVCGEFGVGRNYLRVLVHRAKLRLKAALNGSH
jgi:RNA polymerase sigma-70 factor, ECF subfamily